MSAKSEELEALRQGEPAGGGAGTVHGDGAGGGVRDGAESQDRAKADADSLAETVSLPATERLPGDALSETVSLNTADEHEHEHEHDHMRMRPAAAVTEVAQDVAEETARAVAEADGAEPPVSDAVPGRDSATDDSPEAAKGSKGSKGSKRSEGSEASEAPFPARRQRHTPLYGRGFRVLPWKHRARLNPNQRRRRKIVVRSLWGAVLLFFGTLAWSVAGALTQPGTDTVQARLAEWGRDHGLGGAVAQLEQWQYDLNPPSKGGSVDAKQFTDLGPTTAPSSAKPSASGAVPSKGGAPSTTPPADVIAMQPRMPAPPGLTLESGEGEFQVAVANPAGQPVVQVARVRPDAVYTGVTADVAVIDQKHSGFVLHPGHEGGLNSVITTVPNQIDANARPNLIALFNGGFKISESHGGYYDHGVTAASLVNGAASEVIFKDGHMAVGMWGRDYSFQKNADIVSVRQNLKLMVDGGQVVPYIDDSSTWGRADHGSAAVWRSGVGVKADGDIVWVGGNELTAPSLARLLKDAGAVRAMQLDINLRWADFQYFPNHDGNPDTSKLYEDFLQGPNKFFVNSTKDFMAVYLR
ncbi:phosphodiester glycosidase family protein [Catenulispora acidiphila]|uniref:phosphodiester glycosidase family protein n=1 Tax=Catenulispora acidiphila TaxID=304895 RepID=UPI00117FC378|nr:phosphodiester glycosidase family protein [Catenulispora acidiphila]